MFQYTNKYLVDLLQASMPKVEPEEIYRIVLMFDRYSVYTEKDMLMIIAMLIFHMDESQREQMLKTATEQWQEWLKEHQATCNPELPF